MGFDRGLASGAVVGQHARVESAVPWVRSGVAKHDSWRYIMVNSNSDYTGVPPHLSTIRTQW